jgi:hypothetical protein
MSMSSAASGAPRVAAVVGRERWVRLRRVGARDCQAGDDRQRGQRGLDRRCGEGTNHGCLRSNVQCLSVVCCPAERRARIVSVVRHMLGKAVARAMHTRIFSCLHEPAPGMFAVRGSPSPQPRPDVHVQQRAGPGSSTCEVVSTKKSGALRRLNSRRFSDRYDIGTKSRHVVWCVCDVAHMRPWLRAIVETSHVRVRWTEQLVASARCASTRFIARRARRASRIGEC